MNPRRYSQIERALQVLDKSETGEILRDDQYLLFLFKKTERIVAALYVITGLFQDSEPLKWGIRESGIELIRHTLSFKERSTVNSKESVSDMFAELARLFSLVELAYVADLLSPMNFSVLKKELEAVQSTVEGKWRSTSPLVSPPFFDESFFGISKELFPEQRESGLTLPSSLSGSMEDVSIRSFAELERLKRVQKDIYKGQEDMKDNVLYKKQVTVKSPRIASSAKKPSASLPSDKLKEERTQLVLSVLKKQNKAMIKDFSSVIAGCSEKTIQRLLTELVQGGVLKKEGDRRWSRYSIASAQSMHSVLDTAS